VIYPQKSNHEDRRFDCAGVAYQFPYRDEDSVPVEVKTGSIVFFNGYLLHRSLPNYAKAGYRRVLVNHYMSAESFLPWGLPREGESMATSDSRDIIMIAARIPTLGKALRKFTMPGYVPAAKAVALIPTPKSKLKPRPRVTHRSDRGRYCRVVA